MKSYASLDHNIQWTHYPTHSSIYMSIKQLHRNSFITDNSLVVALTIPNNFFFPSSVRQIVSNMAHIPILVADDRIVRFANEVHSSKAQSPMLVTDDGISILANELHPENVLRSILVTDDGISRLANELHSKKA